MESASAIEYRRFTSVSRKISGVWYIHVPKSLAGAWGLVNGAPIELAIIRQYDKPKEEKKK